MSNLGVLLPGLAVDGGLLQIDCRVDNFILLLGVLRSILFRPGGFS